MDSFFKISCFVFLVCFFQHGLPNSYVNGRVQSSKLYQIDNAITNFDLFFHFGLVLCYFLVFLDVSLKIFCGKMLNDNWVPFPPLPDNHSSCCYYFGNGFKLAPQHGLYGSIFLKIMSIDAIELIKHTQTTSHSPSFTSSVNKN